MGLGERRGGGGRTISHPILGGTRHFFLLILYNFKNIGGHVSPGTPAPRSLIVRIVGFKDKGLNKRKHGRQEF